MQHHQAPMNYPPPPYAPQQQYAAPAPPYHGHAPQAFSGYDAMDVTNDGIGVAILVLFGCLSLNLGRFLFFVGFSFFFGDLPFLVFDDP